MQIDEVLGDFGEKVFGGFQAQDGTPEAELQLVERNFQLQLPLTLRRFYLVAGRHKIVSSAHNRFLSPRKMRIERKALIFLEQNQNVMFWGIHGGDLIKADPPVHQGNHGEPDWYLDARYLSAFLIGVTCWQAANGLRWTGQGKVDDVLLGLLSSGLRSAHPHDEDDVNDLIGYYERDLAVCVSRSAKQFLVGAKDRSQLRSFEEKFQVRLEYL